MASSQAQADDALGAAAVGETVAVPDSQPPSPSADASETGALSRQVEQLSELVRELSREMGEERAIRRQREQDRIAREAGVEHESGNDAPLLQEPPAAQTLFTPTRQAQPLQFQVSPGAADTERGGSPMPAGRAAAQGWSAYGGANNAGWDGTVDADGRSLDTAECQLAPAGRTQLVG